MVVRSRHLQLYLFYFACGLMFLSVVLVISRDTDSEIIKHLDKETKDGSEQNEVNSTKPKQIKSKFLETLADLKQEALSSLSSCSCVPHHRSTWLERGVIVPNILHLVRYGDTPLSYVECVSIKSALLHMNPDKLYLHTNLVDLSNYGQYWNTLYSGNINTYILKLLHHHFFHLLSYLGTFVQIQNISSVTDPILTKLFWVHFWRYLILFLAKIFLDPIFFWN